MKAPSGQILSYNDRMERPARIVSKDNPLVKRFRNVARGPRHGRKEGLFLLEGRHLLEEALRAAWPLEAALVEESLWPSWERALKVSGVPVALVPSCLLQRAGTQPAPEGVLALGLRPVPRWPGAKAGGRYLYLGGVQDPVNAGILIRSAVAFGFDAVFTGPGTADPFAPAALSRSAGAALHLPPLQCGEEKLLAWAKEEKVLLVAAEEGGLPLRAAASSPVLLALGNEGHGLSPSLRAAAASFVGVPMAKGWDSLNVAAAGSILMRDLSRL